MNNVTLFFTNSKDFESDASKIPNPKIGCTYAGGIRNALTDSLVQLELDSSDFLIDTVKITDTSLPSVHIEELQTKAKSLLREKNNLVCMVLNDGLSGTDESVQSIIYHSLPSETTVFGASTGDDLNFKETYCCIDDDIFTGAIVILIGTNLRTFLHKENIYKSTQKQAVVTKSNNRCIQRLNNKLAVDEYSDMIGCSVSSVDNYFMTNPFGLEYDDDLYICSPQQRNSDGSLSTYAEVLEGSIVYLLEPDDYIAKMNETVDSICKYGNPVLTLTSNCILRKLLFLSNRELLNHANSCLNKINAFGFTSYGEQLNGYHINQTMVTVSFYR